MKHIYRLLPPGPRRAALGLGLLLAGGRPAAAQQPAGWPGQPLAVAACTPAAALAGTRVVLSGRGFVGVCGVRFNGVAAADYTVESPTQLTATVPAGAGSGPVSVATAAGVACAAAPLLVPAEVRVLGAQTLPGGTYARLVVEAGGAATLAGDVQVLGGTRVEAGGQLDLGSYVLRGGGFVLAAGGTLRLGHPAGLASAGPSGAVQTELRCFSPEASYVYCPAQPGCQTGAGLPAQVRGLAVAAGPDSLALTLTGDLAISHALRLAAPLATGGHALTLLVLPGRGPALLLGPGTVQGLVRVVPGGAGAAPTAPGLAAAQP